MSFKEQIIENIKLTMAEKGFTNTSLAQKIGTSQSVISQILALKYTLTVDRVEEIAAALGVPPEKLFSSDSKLTTEEKVLLDNFRMIKKCMNKYLNSR